MFFRDEVVAMMTKHVNDMNREVMAGMGAIPSQVDEVISQMQPELDRVNGELYDLLKENGIIP
jgi:hypothetical protein